MTTRGKKNERGASAVEYGLMVALVAAVMMAMVMALGGSLSLVFYDACSDMNGAPCTVG